MRTIFFLAALMTFGATAAAATGKPEPFTIAIPEATLADLKARLKNTRWPDQIAGSGWDYGMDTAYLKGLMSYWEKDFDWRAQEKKLNALHNYKAEVDGIRIHFVHERGKGPNPIPVLMLHGWPSTYIQFNKLIPLLTDPAAHGAPGAQSFDVVVASLPGYGFSDIPATRGFGTREISERMTKLMTDVLGYKKFALRGSDIGGSVVHQISVAHPDKVIGAHVSGLLRGVPLNSPAEPSEAEAKFLKALNDWINTESAYARMHGTKPQTLAQGLNDSPSGLAAWIVEKFHSWGDTKGNVESRFPKDELLTNLTIYWATQTITSSVRFYYEYGREQRLLGPMNVPTAVLMAAHDMTPPPREVSERMYPNLVRWNWTDDGGHFLEWEEPERVAKDMREFFASLRSR